MMIACTQYRTCTARALYVHHTCIACARIHSLLHKWISPTPQKCCRKTKKYQQHFCGVSLFTVALDLKDNIFIPTPTPEIVLQKVHFVIKWIPPGSGTHKWVLLLDPLLGLVCWLGPPLGYVYDNTLLGKLAIIC